MAGAGVKLFVSGEVAYAADINTYLMDQVVPVFDDVADRTNSFGDGIPVSSGGSGKPALSPGRLCFRLDTNQVEYYNGTQWVAPSQFSISDGQVTEAKIAGLAVSSGKIADSAVVTAKIADDAVTTGKILNLNITEGKLANLSVSTGKIIDGAVTTDKILDDAVTAAKLADSASVDANRAVTTNHVRDLAITEAKIAALAISEGKIQDDAVTAAKLSDSASVDASRAVTTNHIRDLAVTEAKLAANAVTATKFRQSAGLSIVGNATNASADVADISAASDATVLRRSGTSLGFGKIINAQVDDAAGIASTKLGPISVTVHAGASGTAVSSTYANQLITVNSATAFNLGLPHSEVSFPTGTTISILQLGAGKVTLTSHDGAQLRSAISGAFSSRAQYSIMTAIKIQSSGTAANNEWLITGDIST